MKKELIEAIHKWWSIVGRPTKEQAHEYYVAEAGEYATAKSELEKLLEGADMQWTFTQWRMLDKTAQIKESYEPPSAAVKAVILSNLSKVSNVFDYSREEAQAHARKLESERYPTVEALPIKRHWVWKATSGNEEGKVLKGLDYKSKEHFYKELVA